MNYERIYEYRFRSTAARTREAVWKVIATDIHARTGFPQRVLDLAAGSGEFVAGLPARDRWALDMVDRGITLIEGVTAVIAHESRASLPSDYFDMIFVSNLLEHLSDQDEVAALLGRCLRRLRPEGQLVVLGPNFRYVWKQYYDFADHRLALTHRSVGEHLHGAGFEVREVFPRFLPYSFGGRLPTAPTLVRLYLRVPLLWRIFGKQFLVIGRRPARDIG